MSVVQTSVVQKIVFQGYAVPRKMVNIIPNISGEIVSINYQVGDTVKAGEILCEIKPDPQIILELINKERSLWLSEKEYSRAQKVYDDNQKLLQHNFISEEEFEKTKYAYEISKKEFDMLKLSIRFYREKYGLDSVDTEELVKGNAYIKSPIDGIVLRNFVIGGNYVKSGLSQYSEGTVICQIGKLDEFVAKLSVAEIDIEHIYPGQRVTIYKNRVLPGEAGYVNKVSPFGNYENQPVTFDVDVVFRPQHSKFIPGSSVDVEIITAQKENIAAIPVESVLIQDGQTFVYQKIKNAFIRKKVSVGISNNKLVEITGGLEPGDQIARVPGLLE